MDVGVGSVLGGRWRLGPVLGEGSCGKVYKVNPTDGHIDYEIVIKVIPTGKSLKGKAAKEQERLANTLNYEYMLHTGMLVGFPYAPRLPGKYYGLDLDVRYLVMERLDMDLVEYALSSPSPSDIAKVGIQLLKGLEWLHKKGYLFIDIKPQNFMLKGNKVYFVDYGLVERWVSFDSSGTRAAETREIVGTPAFLSVNVHRGNTPSRHDEIESLGFVLLSLTQQGRLPWSNCTVDIQCRTMKENCDVPAFCEEHDCPEIGSIIHMSRNSSYTSPPDYAAIENLLTAMQNRKSPISTSTKKPAAAKKVPLQEVTNTSAIEETSTSSNAKKPKAKRAIFDPEPAPTPVVLVREPVAAKVNPTAPVEKMKPRSRTQASGDDVVVDEAPFAKVSCLPIAATSAIEVDMSSPTRHPVRKSPRLSSDRQSFDHEALPFSMSSSSSSSAAHLKSSVQRASKAPSNVAPNVSSSTSGYVFQVIEGPHSGESFSLTDYISSDKVSSLGKGSEPGIMSLSRDEHLSESHLRVKISVSHVVQIMDNSSSNGTTTVNGRQQFKRRWIDIVNNDIIAVGESKLKLISMT